MEKPPKLQVVPGATKELDGQIQQASCSTAPGAKDDANSDNSIFHCTPSSKQLILEESWSPFRRGVSQIVNRPSFDLAVSAVLFSNAVLVVIETNERAKCDLEDWSCNAAVTADALWLKVFNCLMLAIYSTEIAARIFVDRVQWFTSIWHCLEFFVVLLGIIGEVVEAPLNVMVIFRIIRIGRLMRAVRMFTVFRELYIIVHGLISTFKALIWAAVLMIMMLTMWSILAVELILECLNRAFRMRLDCV